MFRPVLSLLRTAPRSYVTVRSTTTVFNRNFSSSWVSHKKAVKGTKGSSNKKAKAEEEEEVIEQDPSIVLKSLESQYKETLKQFKEKATETKLGHSNPKIFDHLQVPLDHKETANFLSIAQTTLKGRNLIITVFDPNYSKHVVSAVLASGMNLNPEAVPNNPQQLKVTLPPPTAEHRKEVAKELKKNFEDFKNSHSLKTSLSSRRADALKELKSYKKNDTIKKVTEDVEKLHKKYAKELEELFKSAEKSVLN